MAFLLRGKADNPHVTPEGAYPYVYGQNAYVYVKISRRTLAPLRLDILSDPAPEVSSLDQHWVCILKTQGKDYADARQRAVAAIGEAFSGGLCFSSSGAAQKM